MSKREEEIERLIKETHYTSVNSSVFWEVPFGDQIDWFISDYENKSELERTIEDYLLSKIFACASSMLTHKRLSALNAVNVEGKGLSEFGDEEGVKHSSIFIRLYGKGTKDDPLGAYGKIRNALMNDNGVLLRLEILKEVRGQ